MALDSAFAGGTIDSEQVAAETSAIATVEGELRAVHLLAHLEMMEILSQDQPRYRRLRGYHGAHQH